MRAFRLARLAPISIAFALGTAVGMFGVGRAHGGSKPDDAPHATLEQLANVLVLIENRYVDPVDRARLIAGAARGMVSELDPHSEFFPPRDFDEFNADTEGKFGGIGVEVDGRGEYLTVIAPIEGGPAEKAGILPGDEIIAIDGVDAKHIGIEKSVHVMRGEPKSRIELTIRRPSEARVFRVPLIREEIKVPSIDVAPLPSGVAFVRIRQFQSRTHADFLAGLEKVRIALGGKMRGVVIDMRRNPGGLVDQAVAVADEALDGGLVFSMKGQGGRVIEEARAHAGGAIASLPIAVLVDGGSASAAELVAAALQDHKRATIVGESTFGKGSVQSIVGLASGAGLKLTIARYYSPNGRSIQGLGVVPDLIVEPTRAPGKESKLPFPKERDLPHALPPELEGKARTEPPPLLPKPKAEATDCKPGVEKLEPLESIASARKPDLDKDAQLKAAWMAVLAAPKR